jgi:hypothetical protein
MIFMRKCQEWIDHGMWHQFSDSNPEIALALPATKAIAQSLHVSLI